VQTAIAGDDYRTPKMLVEYGGWSKTMGKKREATSSSESFEQANLSDMNRQTQRARTKSAIRSDLRTASPTPSLWSSSDISDGGAVPVQVVVNKSGAELAVERQRAHGSLIMATIAMKKQAFEAAKEMHRLFPTDDTWCEALQDAAREYMATSSSTGRQGKARCAHIVLLALWLARRATHAGAAAWWIEVKSDEGGAQTKVP
jgi:hypothetical protein